MNTSTAQARLQVSYGMTETGALRLLAAARTNSIAETATLRVTCTDLYPESFEVADLLGAR